MKYIRNGFDYWSETLVSRFDEVYRRHETNIATIFELMAYTFIELFVAPLRLFAIVAFGITWTIEDHLGKPKIEEVESEKVEIDDIMWNVEES